MFKKLTVIALPIAAQSLITSSLTLVDNLMVGSLGEIELASVGIAIQMYFVHWMITFGFASGASTYMAQFWGSQDLKNIRKTTGFAICVCFLISFVFFSIAMFAPHAVMRVFTNIPEMQVLGAGYVRMGAFTFLTISITVPFTAALRTTQQTKVPLYISIFVFSTNTFLNYLFIFGSFGAPNLGVVGAALATLIARIFELCLILYVVFGRKNIIAGSFSEYFGWTKELVVKILRNSIPTTANEGFWSLGIAMCAAAYARIGVTEYAAVQTCNTINNLFTMAAFSLGDATLILVGEKLGQGKIDFAYALAKKLAFVSAGVGFVFGMTLILVAKPVIGLFDLTPEGKEYAFFILVVYGLFMWVGVHNGVTVTGTLRSGGDTIFAMLVEMGSIWLYAVPMAFFAALYLELPIYFAVLLVRMEDVIKFGILVKRFCSKKWANNMVNGL